MSNNYVRWKDIRAEQVERAGGQSAVEGGKQELLNEMLGHRLAQVRRSHGLTQQEVADRMGVTKGRVSQIEQGKISGQEGRLSALCEPSAATVFDDRSHGRWRRPSWPSPGSSRPRPGAQPCQMFCQRRPPPRPSDFHR